MPKLNILHHKSYHVYSKKNIERVRRDERHAELQHSITSGSTGDRQREEQQRVREWEERCGIVKRLDGGAKGKGIPWWMEDKGSGGLGRGGEVSGSTVREGDEQKNDLEENRERKRKVKENRDLYDPIGIFKQTGSSCLSSTVSPSPRLLAKDKDSDGAGRKKRLHTGDVQQQEADDSPLVNKSVVGEKKTIDQLRRERFARETDERERLLAMGITKRSQREEKEEEETNLGRGYYSQYNPEYTNRKTRKDYHRRYENEHRSSSRNRSRGRREYESRHRDNANSSSKRRRREYL
eukprot:Nk52_evm1s2555 gene=Nk52_evmTU1s2555